MTKKKISDLEKEHDTNYFLDYQKLYAELHVMYKRLIKRVAHLENIISEHADQMNNLWDGNQNAEDRLQELEAKNEPVRAAKRPSKAKDSKRSVSNKAR